MRAGDTSDRDHVLSVPWKFKHSEFSPEFWQDWQQRAGDQGLVLSVRRARAAQRRVRGAIADEFINTLCVKAQNKKSKAVRVRAFEFLADFVDAVGDLMDQKIDDPEDSEVSTDEDEDDGADLVEATMYGTTVVVSRTSRQKDWLRSIRVDKPREDPMKLQRVGSQQLVWERHVPVRRHQTSVRLQSVSRQEQQERVRQRRERSRVRRYEEHERRRKEADKEMEDLDRRMQALISDGQRRREEKEREQQRLLDEQKRLEEEREQEEKRRLRMLSITRTMDETRLQAEQEMLGNEMQKLKIAEQQGASELASLQQEQQDLKIELVQQTASMDDVFKDSEALRLQQEVDYDDVAEDALDLLRECALRALSVVEPNLVSEDMLLGSGAQRAVALVWHRWSSDGGSSVGGGGAFMVCKLRVQCVFDKLRQRLRTAVNIASSVDGQPEESSRVILAVTTYKRNTQFLHTLPINLMTCWRYRHRFVVVVVDLNEPSSEEVKEVDDLLLACDIAVQVGLLRVFRRQDPGGDGWHGWHAPIGKNASLLAAHKVAGENCVVCNLDNDNFVTEDFLIDLLQRRSRLLASGQTHGASSSSSSAGDAPLTGVFLPASHRRSDHRSHCSWHAHVALHWRV